MVMVKVCTQGVTMDRPDKINLALGVIGSSSSVTAALVTASHHETLACVLLTILANIWVGRTIFLFRLFLTRK